MTAAGRAASPRTRSPGSGAPGSRSTGSRSPGSRAPGASLGRSIDELCAPWARDGSPGCVVAVIRGGEVLHCRGYGLADRERRVPLQPGTVFELGSLAKQLTAACVALLAAAGRLRLDDDVRDYLPEMRGHGDGITVAQLVHHTSGVRDYLELLAFAGRRHLPVSPAQVLELLGRQRGLNFKPGSAFRYSNSGYVLLAAIVERAAGRPLAEVARTAIFEPLGMSGTAFAGDGRRDGGGDAALAYWPSGGGFTADAGGGSDLAGDGGLRTTAEDACRWERNVHENRLEHGGPELLRRLATPGRLDSGEPVPYAFGLFLGRLGRHPILYHGGTMGAYRAGLVRVPEHALSVLCLANLGTLDAVQVARRIAARCLGERLRPSPPPVRRPRPVLTAAQGTALAGLFRSTANGRIWRLSASDGELYAESGPLQARLTPAGAGRVRADGAVAFTLTWRPRRDGSVTRLRFAADGEAAAALERLRETVLAPAALLEYTGSYACHELGVTHEIRGGQGLLLLAMEGLPFVMPLAPTLRDEFTTQGVVIRFQRDAAGRVGGFAVSSPGVSELPFVRETGAADGHC